MARPAARHGLARALSKRGLCSRSEAERWIRAGRVAVDGRVVRDPEHPVDVFGARITIDGRAAVTAASCYLALNKPRGLVTTASDERGRDTVYRCFDGAGLGWIAPVGRLDQASEGLLLFTNDPAWAAAVTDPATGPVKVYHVQVDGHPDAAVRPLREGGRNAWLEVELHEGRNRHIRRLAAACGLGVLRLVRVRIGPVALGALGKGAWRPLEPGEIAAFAPPSAPAAA